MNYNEDLPNYGDLMTVKEFTDRVISGSFIDYDGNGSPVKDGKMMGKLTISPSTVHLIPEDATHIMWFNR